MNINPILETSLTEQNLDTRIHPQSMETNPNETTEKDFNSTLLDDGTFF